MSTLSILIMIFEYQNLRIKVDSKINSEEIVSENEIYNNLKPGE